MNSSLTVCTKPGLSVVVAGLVWVMGSVSDAQPFTHEVLVGPAVGAALGVRAAGAVPEFLVAISDSLSDTARRLIRALDASGHLIRLRHALPLRWSANPVLADTRRWHLDGDPRPWFATCDPTLLTDRVLVLANGNPSAHADLLETGRQSFAVIDIDASWAASQVPALRRCLRRAQLVTITQGDYARLPSDLLAGSGLGQRHGAALVIKSGEGGVTVIAEGEQRQLPAPVFEGPIGTDIGAGDVLLGILGARLGLQLSPISAEDIESAYRAALPVVARLLQSADFIRFADALLEQHNAA